MGLSPFHASTVPLVYTPATGSITAQFHVVFDDWFSTIATSIDNLPDFNSPAWSNLFGDSTYEYIFEEEDLGSEPPPDSKDFHDILQQDRIRSSFDPPAPIPGDIPPPSGTSPFEPTPNPFLVLPPLPQRENTARPERKKQSPIFWNRGRFPHLQG